MPRRRIGKDATDSMVSTALPFAQAPPICIACESAELGNNRRRDVRVAGADQVDRPKSDIDRKSAGFNERDERPKTAHPRHAMGVALIAERAVVGPGYSAGIARNDHADLIRERERRVGNGSFPDLAQRRLEDLQTECRALQLVKTVDLSENRRGDDDLCQVLSDEP